MTDKELWNEVVRDIKSYKGNIFFKWKYYLLNLGYSEDDFKIESNFIEIPKKNVLFSFNENLNLESQIIVCVTKKSIVLSCRKSLFYINFCDNNIGIRFMNLLRKENFNAANLEALTSEFSKEFKDKIALKERIAKERRLIFNGLKKYFSEIEK